MNSDVLQEEEKERRGNSCVPSYTPISRDRCISLTDRKEKTLRHSSSSSSSFSPCFSYYLHSAIVRRDTIPRSVHVLALRASHDLHFHRRSSFFPPSPSPPLSLLFLLATIPYLDQEEMLNRVYTHSLRQFRPPSSILISILKSGPLNFSSTRASKIRRFFDLCFFRTSRLSRFCRRSPATAFFSLVEKG